MPGALAIGPFWEDDLVTKLRPFLLAACLFLAAAPVQAQSFDSNYYYRIVNSWQKDKSLDVNPQKPSQVQLAKTGNYTGQHWQIVSLGNGSYQLRNRWQTGKSLTTHHTLTGGSTLYLGDTIDRRRVRDDYTQDWKFRSTGNGYYRLTSACRSSTKTGTAGNSPRRGTSTWTTNREPVTELGCIWTGASTTPASRGGSKRPTSG